MKSPFTNGETQLKKEHRDFVFRKESFTVLYHYYVCKDTKEQFTTSSIDTLNLAQVHNKYREKYGIPFTDEIIDIRKKYGLSASKMSEVLGFGANGYRNYEDGEIPSVANGRLIRLAERPEEFIELLEMSKNTFEKKQYHKVLEKVQDALNNNKIEQIWFSLLFGNPFPTVSNGYKVPNFNKIGSMVSYFAKNNKPFTTALNKLMFYADFGHYKTHGNSISGIYYKALQKGPVPENYGVIYNHVINAGYARIEENDFGDFIGEKCLASEVKGLDLFSEIEIDTLKKISHKFKHMNTKAIVGLSHDEPGWIHNIDEKNRITYEYSFELKHVD
ncbi:MAG: DUF4065 domain-containing protein [Chitinophagaceae bacterium]|nr:DUF4065 domain-containing protein [Chitinophagaceae bacterium]